MDLAGLIDRLDELVQQAKSMPLSSSVLVNREELLATIAEMREELPEEIQQARRVVRDREELLLKARMQADEIVARAKQEQLRLAEREEVVRRAHEEAARILSQGQDGARALRVDAESYADEKLRELTDALRATLEEVGRAETALAQSLAQAEHGRTRLRADVAGLPDEPPQPATVPAGPFDEEEQRS